MMIEFSVRGSGACLLRQRYFRLSQPQHAKTYPRICALCGVSFQPTRIRIQERFNKLIYGINMIIKCGILQPVKFQLVSHF